MSSIRTRRVVVGVVLLLSLQPLQVEAHKRDARGRYLSVEYTGPSTGIETPRLTFHHDMCTADEPGLGCVVEELRPRDRFVTVRLYDAAAGPLVAAAATVESDDGDWDFLGYVCGDSMEVPLAIPEGYDFLEVNVFEGTCYGTTTPSLPTTGTVEMYISNVLFPRS